MVYNWYLLLVTLCNEWPLAIICARVWYHVWQVVVCLWWVWKCSICQPKLRACQVKSSPSTHKGRYSSSWEPHLRVTGHYLPYGITQCYLLPDTSERGPPNPSHAGWYSIYLPRRDGRLSWPSWLDSTPAGSWTSDLLITSLTPNRCTTNTT